MDQQARHEQRAVHGKTKSTMLNLITSLTKRSIIQVFADWKVMIDVSIDIRDVVGEQLEAEVFLGSLDATCIAMETRVEGACGGPFFLFFPEPFVLKLISPMMEFSDEEVEAKRLEGLDDDDIEAFKEMANLLCGSSNNVLSQTGKKLRISQSVDHLKLYPGRGCKPEEHLPDFPTGELSATRIEVDFEGTSFQLIQVIPGELAMALAGVFIPAGI